MPTDEARMFLASAINEWLQNGGDLARDYFQVVKPKSKHTAAYIWSSLHHPDERQRKLSSSQCRHSTDGEKDAVHT
jgi:hypothetical protein